MYNEESIVFFGKKYVAIWRSQFCKYWVSYGNEGDDRSKAIVEIKLDEATSIYDAFISKGVGILSIPEFNFSCFGESIELAVRNLEIHIKTIVGKLLKLINGNEYKDVVMLPLGFEYCISCQARIYGATEKHKCTQCGSGPICSGCRTELNHKLVCYNCLEKINGTDSIKYITYVATEEASQICHQCHNKPAEWTDDILYVCNDCLKILIDDPIQANMLEIQVRSHTAKEANRNPEKAKIIDKG